jgi:hypothetical protein
MVMAHLYTLQRARYTWLQQYHYKFYLGEDGSGRRLPDAFGIRELWETNSLTEVGAWARASSLHIAVSPSEYAA